MLGKLLSVTRKLQEKQAQEIYLRKSMELEKARGRSASDFTAPTGSTPVAQGTGTTTMPEQEAAPKAPSKPKPVKTTPAVTGTSSHYIEEHLGPQHRQAFENELHSMLTSGKHEEAIDHINRTHLAAASKHYVKKISEALGRGDREGAHKLVNEHRDLVSQIKGNAPAQQPSTPTTEDPKIQFAEWKTPAQFPATAKLKSKLGNLANFISSRGVPAPATTIDNSPISSVPEDKNPATAPGVTDPNASAPQDTELDEKPQGQGRFTEMVNIENIDPALLRPADVLPLEELPLEGPIDQQETTPVAQPTPAPQPEPKQEPSGKRVIVSGRKQASKQSKPQVQTMTAQPAQDANRERETAVLNDLKQKLSGATLHPSYVSQGRKGSLAEQEAQKERKAQEQKQQEQPPVDEAERDAKLAALKEKIKQGKYKAAENVAEAFVEGGQK